MPDDFGFDENFYDEEDADEFSESSGSHEYREIILQQSVTMLAYMDRTTHNATVTSGITEPRMLLGFFVNDFAILIGAVIGAAGLILVILTAIAIWHCCRLKRRPNKTFCLDNSTPDESSIKQGNGTMIQSESVVFMGNNNHVSTKAVGSKSDICQSVLTRSQSVPLKEEKELPKPPVITKVIPKRRPVSQPVRLPLSFQSASCSPKRAQLNSQHYYKHLEEVDMPFAALTSIPEVGFRNSEILHDAPSHTLYASCNALDGSCAYSSLYTHIDPNVTMKTRSLPLWGRTRPRPLSTEDDLNELYAKVSFSKKRKNRMRSDSAAAIAVNKSRCSYLTIPSAHKDTDSLIDNEAVVVYDERTAL